MVRSVVRRRGRHHRHRIRDKQQQRANRERPHDREALSRDGAPSGIDNGLAYPNQRKHESNSATAQPSPAGYSFPSRSLGCPRSPPTELISTTRSGATAPRCSSYMAEVSIAARSSGWLTSSPRTSESSPTIAEGSREVR